MTEEQINEAMRLGELWATYAWKACSHGADETVKSQAGRAALEAYLRTIARAESSIETPAKVSPCAGHAVQQEAGHEND